MALIKPRIFIVQDDDDANTVLSGILWLKGVRLSNLQEQRNV